MIKDLKNIKPFTLSLYLLFQLNNAFAQGGIS